MVDDKNTDGFGGAAPPTAPADSYRCDLNIYSFGAGVIQYLAQQLQDMGFTNASQNVRAILATGGNVHSAIEYILGGGGL